MNGIDILNGCGLSNSVLLIRSEDTKLIDVVVAIYSQKVSHFHTCTLYETGMYIKVNECTSINVFKEG